ncbi:MAG: metallophosphoesterase [Deltaproteobacteria bacterium]|nr:metallophosphoesterase [Deltaproteobacteria bacterium]
MATSSLRRALFERLFLNLSLLLGLFQVLVWHWWSAVLLGEEGPGLALAIGVALPLVGANYLAAPVLRRHRRRGGWLGRIARAYMNLGVVTLLLGMTIAALWALFLLPAGLLGMLGASPEASFGVFRLASVASVGGVALLLLWGFTVGQARVARTQLRIPLPGLAPELSGLRIVQISDLHIGNGLEGSRLARMVERTNALDPDVIVLTGDLFDSDPSFVEHGVRMLSGLRARHGVYAVLGNHDVYTGSDRIAEALARLAPRLRLLRNELVRLPLVAPLYLAGVEDPGLDWSARSLEVEGLTRLAAARPADGPSLLLVHRPEVFEQAARLGFPLVLAGHTHGGQLALPTPGGRYNLARLVTPLARGLYRSGASVLYVNRGLGVGGPPLRVNCPREIASFVLEASNGDVVKSNGDVVKG